MPSDKPKHECWPNHRTNTEADECSNKPKWTPGPWAIKDSPQGPCRIIGYDGHGNHVANVFASDLSDGAANALLIAAAPEMVEALRWLDAAARTLLFGGPDEPVRGNVPLTPQQEAVRFACVDARAALRKAGL